MTGLDRFYPIFDSSDWIDRAVGLGVRLVQLRVKDKTGADLRAEISRSIAICEGRADLVINDHWRLAIDLGAPWLHLGQEDLEQADMAAIRRSDIRLGISTHDEEELERALSHNPDYVALGPVYPTILKKMKWHAQGLDRVSQWKARIKNLPLVAIGGMSVARASGAFAAGADIVAAVTDITLNPDPDARMREWIEVTR